MSDRMKRRTFLGWLGLSGAAMASSGTAVALYSEPPIVTPTAKGDAPSLSKRFVIANEGASPMIISYKRVDGDREDAPGGYNSRKLHEDGRRGGTMQMLQTILLPGEELTITAIEATL